MLMSLKNLWALQRVFRNDEPFDAKGSLCHGGGGCVHKGEA